MGATMICVLSALSHALSNVIIKKLENVGPFTIVAVRFMMILLVTAPIVVYR